MGFVQERESWLRDVHMKTELLKRLLYFCEVCNGWGIEPSIRDWIGCDRNVESCVSSTSDFPLFIKLASCNWKIIPGSTSTSTST